MFIKIASLAGKLPIRHMLFKSEQKWLYQMAAVGFVLGIFSFTCLLLQKAGIAFSPELRLDKPSSICTAFGVFLTTTALLIPLTGLTKKANVRFQRLLSIAVYYGYSVEVIQVFRGVDPRFGTGNFYMNVLPGIVDGVLFFGVILMYIWLMLQFFTARSYRINPLLVLGIRYGLLASMLGFASGLWMAVVQTRYFGEQGNILDVHFLGFHGLQAAPVLALLLGKCTAAAVRRHRLLHAAGLLWFALAAYAFVPTYLGRSLFAWSDPWVLPVYILLAAWVAVAILVMVMFAGRRTALSEKTSLAPASS